MTPAMRESSAALARGVGGSAARPHVPGVHCGHLGAWRHRQPPADPDDYDILNEYISNEPLAPVVRQDDLHFWKVVHWTLAALIAAEQLGVTASNVNRASSSDDPDVRRLIGSVPGNGRALGLDEQWGVHAIEGVE